MPSTRGPERAAAGEASSRTVERALMILDLLLEAKSPLGVTAIGQRIGVNKSTVYRLLRTMERYDLVEQRPFDSKYWLGPKLCALGEAAPLHSDLLRAARPHVERLAQKTSETTNLVRHQGNSCVYLLSIPTDHPIGMIARPVGARDPLHSTAAGKAILAFLKPAQAESILLKEELARLTPHTKTRPEEILSELALVRARGYAVDDRETHEHTCCTGAPVFNKNGLVIGAVSVSGPEFRMTPEAVLRIAPLVMECAVDVASALGLDRSANPLAPFLLPR